ncbi:MAG: AMP-binding protein [Campylobacter sp.]|nr:AMP-binding protein [Campylobacter sp.]
MDMIGKKNLCGYFDELAFTHKDKIAVICEDISGKISSLSYKSLNEKINQTANLLKSIGVKKDDLVIIHLTNSLEYILSLMAIAKLGAVAVPINANYVYADTLFIVQKTKPTLVITQSEFVKIYEEIDEKKYEFKNDK